MLDGHYRILAAKQEGQRFMDAHVVEYLPSEDADKRSLAYRRIELQERTRLQGLDLSNEGNYDILLSQIEKMLIQAASRLRRKD